MRCRFISGFQFFFFHTAHATLQRVRFRPTLIDMHCNRSPECGSATKPQYLHASLNLFDRCNAGTNFTPRFSCVLTVMCCFVSTGLAGLQCTDWEGNPVPSGQQFVPKSDDPCYECTCEDGFPAMCTSVLCSAPECEKPKEPVAVSIL